MSAQGMPAPRVPTAPGPALRTPHAAPPRKARRGSRTVMVLGFIAVLAVTAAAASIAWKLTMPSPEEPVSTAPSALSTPAPVPTPPPRPTVSASARPAPPPKPTPPPPPVPRDTAQCFATMLPEKAFGNITPKLDRLCTDTRAYPTMLQLKAVIVRAGGSYAVTPAMDEWSKLGWFETAAFAAMRGHCCPDAPALVTGRTLSRCKMEEALAYIANAIDDDKKMKEATALYAEAARCLAMSGGGFSWGRFSAPYGGEEVYFNKVFDRLKKARGR